MVSFQKYQMSYSIQCFGFFVAITTFTMSGFGLDLLSMSCFISSFFFGLTSSLLEFSLYNYLMPLDSTVASKRSHIYGHSLLVLFCSRFIIPQFINKKFIQHLLNMNNKRKYFPFFVCRETINLQQIDPLEINTIFIPSQIQIQLLYKNQNIVNTKENSHF